MTIISKDINQAASIIRDGGVVLCPAEGVYGISCDALNNEAIKRVIAIKQRDDSKGLITVASSKDMLNKLVDFEEVSPRSHALMERLWPGPFTFIVPCKKQLDSLLTGKRQTLAVRMTAFETMAKLCDLAGVPLVSTSANISGIDAVSTFEDLDKTICERVDLVLDLPCGGLSSPTSIYDTVLEHLVRKGLNWPEDIK